MIYIGGAQAWPRSARISRTCSKPAARPARAKSWYGARSKQELFYHDYFEGLAKQFANFTFNAALSSPLPEDEWTGHAGMIHEVLMRQYLKDHPNPPAAEYYLCGPPMMIKACRKMLTELGVPDSHIAFDEF